MTPFEHLVRDYQDGPAWSRHAHFDEWVRLMEKIADEDAVQKRVQHLLDTDYSIHYHVWTQKEMFELIHRLNDEFDIPIELEMFMKNNGEAILILRKTA